MILEWAIKKKMLGLSGSLHSDFSDIQNKNKAIISFLKNASSTVELTHSWQVGAILSLFDDESREVTDALI